MVYIFSNPNEDSIIAMRVEKHKMKKQIYKSQHLSNVTTLKTVIPYYSWYTKNINTNLTLLYQTADTHIQSSLKVFNNFVNSSRIILLDLPPTLFIMTENFTVAASGEKNLHQGQKSDVFVCFYDWTILLTLPSPMPRVTLKPLFRKLSKIFFSMARRGCNWQIQ